MNTNEEIAREAWNKINSTLQLGREANKIGIAGVLSAITKATEARRHWQVWICEDGSIALGPGSHTDRKPITVYELESGAAPASAEQQEEWRAGHDGCGTWGIYHGEEKRKGWSGNGKLLVSGISERQAKEIEAAHNG